MYHYSYVLNCYLLFEYNFHTKILFPMTVIFIRRTTVLTTVFNTNKQQRLTIHCKNAKHVTSSKTIQFM